MNISNGVEMYMEHKERKVVRIKEAPYYPTVYLFLHLLFKYNFQNSSLDKGFFLL